LKAVSGPAHSAPQRSAPGAARKHRPARAIVINDASRKWGIDMFDWNLLKRSDTESSSSPSMFSFKSLALAVPALWLGGCLATHRPAWFMRRSTAERVREAVQDSLHLKRQSKWWEFSSWK
jgi:hypothetical protein